ncbi:thiamine pyrophosphate-dependent dehydrogenase E1 component subunit alpha (plasmid) [Paraburkholderia sprentiae WSM5005]|uniref:Thiamine pyrophosphate-dependent dehydrogenase E1 component subunit alpha n=1 Tax=Paraburkholderia sprentiae WSM5005 TaxID=754502 RepID=A0A1I9YTP1_9BURK|nr:thiamine pyrophosphate-dependent dehydrogenase E1 component subunit alpha [Paraburkholderia sprentiae]APA89574.1 thiamine pyrophosphate-dependent dehydrogenase E1 component subunit alpha [Paraburkholderia sprentiae WSM5005]
MNAYQPPSSEVLVDIYRRMALIKQNDERFRAVIKAGKLVMPYYSPRGQEVIPSAMSVCLTDDDYICTIYRGVHDMIAKGVPLKELWAELGGRVTGTCKGKGGPMHVTHPASGVMVTTGIVGSSMPIANGLALAAQIRGESRVAVAYFGDGASNIGAFHESLNMASVWKLPVIFVCQNNGYAEHTKYAYGTSVPNIAQRAVAYQMPGITVDGNDPIQMHKAAHEAVERARNGAGPTLIEANTFRFQGHVFGDPDAYMDKHEKAAWLAKDPVPLFRQWLIDAKHATEEQLVAMEAEHEAQIDAAVAFTLSSEYPDVAELRRDIFKDEVLA